MADAAGQQASASVRVACVQAEPAVLGSEPTLDELAALTAEARRAGAELVAVPESYLARPLCGEEPILYADLDRRRLDEERQRFDPAGYCHRPDVLELRVGAGREDTQR